MKQVLKEQIRSKKRVRDLAEVFTAPREVGAMLDLLGEMNKNITATYLEPACGNGNFLVEILKRKLDQIVMVAPDNSRKFEILLLQAVASLYGIDISPINIAETKSRLRADVLKFIRKFDHLSDAEFMTGPIDYILDTNIQIGDMLNGTDDITITEFTVVREFRFQIARFHMSDMLKNRERGHVGKPFDRLTSVHYRSLGSEI